MSVVRSNLQQAMRIGVLGMLFGGPQGWADPVNEVLLPAIQENCIQCHGRDGKVKGKVDLRRFNSANELKAAPELLSDLIEVLDLGEMPPEDQPPLKDGQRKALITGLQSLLDEALSEGATYPHTPMRRMNRFQYANAVRDLFELRIEVFSLPERMMRSHTPYFNPAKGKMPDHVKVGSRPLGKSQLIEPRLAGVAPFPQDLRAEHGFDNQADHLSLSPMLLESFLKLSRSITESPDFNRKNCGIWKEFFEPPKAGAMSEVIRPRLQDFLFRAFRQPVEDELLDRYTSHVLSQFEQSGDFTAAMKAAAAAALASPRFLYLYENASEANESNTVDPYALASRLSFFLWGSIPDQALLDLAADRSLTDPLVLDAQVSRMLMHPKMKRFCDSFPAQWLQLDRIISSTPDRKLYPDFYYLKYRTSMHMMAEPLLLFETVFVENRPILEFIDSDYSYRSKGLDAWYRGNPRAPKGAPTVMDFTRVAVKDRREGGLITTAATMTMTSNATRSQPITRGAWMAGVIFNNPPAPPPADVPPLKEEITAEENDLTLRERFEAHRSRKDCAACHARIDPLGFALENYGATGLWRDQYNNGREVDPSGRLFRKHDFSTVEEFKDAILIEKDRFTRGFAGHLLGYALGRKTSAIDAPSLDEITKKTAENDYQLQYLIRQIILSDPFRQKSHPPTPVEP